MPTPFIRSRFYEPRRSKYNNRCCTLDGYRFDSLKERDRYRVLKAQEDVGVITELIVHPAFELLYAKATGQCFVRYVADFLYYDQQGQRVVEDVKGVKTAMYRLKKRMLKEFYEIDVVEI